MLFEIKKENTIRNVTTLYVPNITKSKEEKVMFYEKLQDLLDTRSANEY